MILSYLLRGNRQHQVAEWCAAAFGDDHAKSIEQRGIRLVEEAIEAGQAAGCDPAMVHRLVDHIYAKPVGDLRQELGGVGVTLLALAQAADIDADRAERDEIARVLSKPLEHFAARNAAKNAAGFNVLTPAAERPRIYLDLDGVMADFDGTFPHVFGLDHRDMADDEMWARINSHPDFFRSLPAMPGAYDFIARIRHLHPIILTACPKSNYAHVACQKREWVREHLGAGVTVLPVWGGASKPLFMHSPGDVLIDDYRRNTEAWAAAGGMAILHRDFERTSAMLDHILAHGRFPIEITSADERANDNNPARVERKETA